MTFLVIALSALLALGLLGRNWRGGVVFLFLISPFLPSALFVPAILMVGVAIIYQIFAKLRATTRTL